jgi:transcriptional regulator of arginine metabolism
MRYSRQNKIIELISTHVINTQEGLAELLREAGYEVTQATISRDIKELQLVKSLASDGVYKYSLPGVSGQAITDRFLKIYKETIQSVSSSGNIILIKTLSGCGNAAAETIDNMDIPYLLGSVAGDNTIFLLVDEPRHVPEIVRKFEELLRK